jgi:hypothetical protein
MCTAAWPIQRARPRPRPCPLWPFDPSRRLKTTFRFWQQIRPHARTIAPTHKRTLTRASTPPATRANALANASRKHTHAQTPRRRKSPTRTNATRTAHAPTNARTDANDTPRGCYKCPRTRVHAYQHGTRSNTPTQHLKVNESRLIWVVVINHWGGTVRRGVHSKSIVVCLCVCVVFVCVCVVCVLVCLCRVCLVVVFFFWAAISNPLSHRVRASRVGRDLLIIQNSAAK